MGYFQVGYASRLVLYEHKMFTRLAIEWAIFVEFLVAYFLFIMTSTLESCLPKSTSLHLRVYFHNFAYLPILIFYNID